MKIGFVVSFFDFRNDVRRVIQEISQNHEVVIFGLKRDEASIRANLPENVKFRIINEELPSRWNWLWSRLYNYCRKIPLSRQNFYLMELFKASNQPTAEGKRRALKAYRILRICPKFISYDFYLDQLKYSSKTEISDVDQFVCFTEISDDLFFKRLIDSGKNLKVYVYSWDHPCKHTRFSKKVKYLCWDEGIKRDLIELQGLNPSKIFSSGASQFGFISDFLNMPEESLTKHYLFDYVYFGCAIGIDELVEEEIRIIKIVAASVENKMPSVKLVVRPYPVLRNWHLYEELKNNENIILDNTFRGKDLSISNESIFEKFEKIHFAKAFFHLGTTLGLEACFTNTPSFIIDFGYKQEKKLGLFSFIHQYQNEKYLIKPSPLNYLKSREDLEEVLSDIKNKKFLQLGFLTKERIALLTFKEFSKIILYS